MRGSRDTLTRGLTAALVLAAMLALGACEERSPGPLEMAAEPAAAELVAAPEELGRLGARLEAEPEAAERLLEEEGLTLSEFADAVRSVAADAELAARYAEGFRAEQQRLGGGEDGT
jgi:hypothetical protein